jgi:hypothetical protein
MELNLKNNILFKNFTDLSIDRFKFLAAILETLKLPYKLLEIRGAKHLVVYPDNLLTNCTCFIAHYDRVPGTPGANDNSASVFYLIEHLSRIKDKNHSTLGIFTDKEEISCSDSVKSQGAYGLGEYFKQNNLKPYIYIFDMCGIGSTLLLGTGGETLLKKNSSRYKKTILELEKLKLRAQETFLSVNYGEFFYLTPMFSDDLGLLLNGFPSVLISLLPYREAVEYQKNPEKLPLSWRCNHTPLDTLETLDPASGEIILHLMDKLSKTYVIKGDINKLSGKFNCYTQKISPVNFKDPVNFLNYIENEDIDFSGIKSNSSSRIELFRLLMARTNRNFFYYLMDKIPNITHDYYFDIYQFIKITVETQYTFLPLGLRTQILRILNCRDNEIAEYIFNRVVSNLGDILYVQSTPLREKKQLTYSFEGVNSDYILRIKSDITIGEIKISVNNKKVMLIAGEFSPEKTLEYDPLNLLKALRTILIKWAKLNNNTTLGIELKNELWLGCGQLFTLLKMELHGRSDIIWKEYNV